MNTFSGSKNILSFQSVRAGYPNKVVLNNIDLSLGKGEFSYLIGKTGAGKSSILKLIYGEMKPLSGHGEVGQFVLETLKRKDIPKLRRKIGIVFQDFQLLPDRNVYENIRFALRATGWKDAKKIKQRITELLVKVGLSAKMKNMPHQLSGGEQQRVTIARALINDPILILADEPTGNLDPEATENIMRILFEINLAGTAILMATHEHTLIHRYPARTLECVEGRLVDHKLQFQGFTAW